MENKKWFFFVAIISVMTALWFSGVVPKQIAKIYGANYIKKHFTEMQLGCTGIEWSKVHGDYLITLKGKNGKEYRCVIGPKYFPVFIGQGLFAIESDYAECGP